jgi:hypothetical protein
MKLTATTDPAAAGAAGARRTSGAPSAAIYKMCDRGVVGQFDAVNLTHYRPGAAVASH